MSHLYVWSPSLGDAKQGTICDADTSCFAFYYMFIKSWSCPPRVQKKSEEAEEARVVTNVGEAFVSVIRNRPPDEVARRFLRHLRGRERPPPAARSPTL